MSRYSEHLDEFLTSENRINAHFFKHKTPSDLGGAYRYIKTLENAVLNVHIILSIDNSLFKSVHFVATSN